MIVRPVIILSSPRAGSTLLFETLCKHPALWSIGGESHALIEHIPQLSTVARGYRSNCLTKVDATYEIADVLKQRFITNARDFKGNAYRSGTIRLLEKTPKNALRVEFFNAIFPDAIFIHLIRDPKENISSIMEAWRSGRFITYPNLPHWHGHWSLLLPENWQSQKGQSLQQIAAWQWQQANEAILKGLGSVPESRKLTITYQELISNPQATLKIIAEAIDIEYDDFRHEAGKALPLSRYTLTKPAPDKWRNNAALLHEATPTVMEVMPALNQVLEASGKSLLNFDCVEKHLEVNNINSTNTTVSRNADCPCGSGKKYKRCHGQLEK